MTAYPNTWIEEDRDDIVTEIVDGMIAQMTFEEMRSLVWDILYEDLIWRDWSDLWMEADAYAPDLLEKFEDSSKEETSR